MIKIVLILFASVTITIVWLLNLLGYVGMYLPSFISGVTVLTFLIYAWDKRKAKQSAYKKVNRVSERTLHLLALFGGWPGALLAQQLIRHKSQKRAFITVLWICILINVLCLVALLGYVQAS